MRNVRNILLEDPFVAVEHIIWAVASWSIGGLGPYLQTKLVVTGMAVLALSDKNL